VNIFVHITSVASIYILTKFLGHYKELGQWSSALLY